MKPSSIIHAVMLLLFVSFTTHAEEFSLQDFNGKPASIEQYSGKGKWLVVMIWAHDCTVCNQEVGNYELFHTGYKNKNASVLGISIDGEAGKDKAAEFVARHKLSFPNLIGNAWEFKEFFSRISEDFARQGWQGMPTPAFLIYNPKGELDVQEIGGVPVELVESYIKQNSSK